MKHHLFLVALILSVMGLSSCQKKDGQLFISDDANILTEQDEARLTKMFTDSSYKDVYLFTVPENMTYAEAMDYRSPNDKVSWFKRNYVFKVYYFPQQKWFRVSISAERQNDFQRKYMIPFYHLQHDIDGFSDDMDDVLVPVLKAVLDLSDERASVWASATSILSIVDYMNEELILPSDNLFHLLFFRVPLYISLLWVNVFKGTGWPIALLTLLLIVISFCRNITKKHVWMWSILYVVHLLAFVVLIFLTVPSFDTMQLIKDMGWTQAGVILDNAYMRAEAMEHSWVASVIFIALYLIHRVLGYYMKEDPLAGKSQSEQTDKKTETASDQAQGTIMMFILAFMFPKYIVWAVSAYLLQQIICSDILRQEKPQGAPASSIFAVAIVISLCCMYFMVMLDWWICTFSHIGATYRWASEGLSSLLIRLDGSWWARIVDDLTGFVVVFAGFGTVILGCVSLFTIESYVDLSANAGGDQSDEMKYKVGKAVLNAVGMVLLTWIASLVFLWTVAVNNHIDTTRPTPQKPKTIIVSQTGLPYTQQVYSYSRNDTLQEDTIKRYWREKKNITSVAYTNAGWLISAAKNTGYTKQVYKVTDAWPGEWIMKYWQNRYHITSLSCSHRQWLVVMSQGSDYKRQSYAYKKTDELLNWWYNEKPKNQLVTDICFNNGNWVIVTSETRKYPKQRYLWTPADKVKATIKEKIWNKHYNIQLMEYGGGQYLIFYGPDWKGAGQIYNFDASDVAASVKHMWDNKHQISYIGGGYDSIPSRP